MKNDLAREFYEAVKTYETQLQVAAKGNPEKESALRWSKAHVPYEVIAPFMTRENLAQLGRQAMAGRLLMSLSSNRLEHADRFRFWEDILSAVEVLPKEWRAKICLDCLRSGESWEPRERNGKIPYYSVKDYDKEALAGYVVSSKWLVEAPLVRQWYCRLHKPGYELLSCIDQKREVKYPLRDKLLKYISNDDVPGFELTYTLCGQGGNWTLLQDVLKNGAIRIFDSLVENQKEVFLSVKPFHLMIYSVSNLAPKMALAVVKSLERRFPGMVAQTDEFGNNLLWYSLHNRKKKEAFEPHAGPGEVEANPMGKLIMYLCQCGCRMDTKNYLGLSYSDLSKAVTFAKLRLSLDDYKELVLLALVQIQHLPVAAAEKLMQEYQDSFQEFYEDGIEPYVAAGGMVTHFL